MAIQTRKIFISEIRQKFEFIQSPSWAYAIVSTHNEVIRGLQNQTVFVGDSGRDKWAARNSGVLSIEAKYGEKLAVLCDHYDAIKQESLGPHQPREV